MIPKTPDFSAFKTFIGDLVVPTDPDYDMAICRWATNAVWHVKVVALVKGPADVGLAMLKRIRFPLPSVAADTVHMARRQARMVWLSTYRGTMMV
jgi:hypothetical protein